MERQIGFAEAESAGKKRVTKRQRFLAEMEKVVPWSRLLSVIKPYYPKGERGRPPIGLERMLRKHGSPIGLLVDPRSDVRRGSVFGHVCRGFNSRSRSFRGSGATSY